MALLLESDERLERLREELPGWQVLGVAEPEVDHVEYLEAEVLEVLVDRATQAFRVLG